MRRTKPMITAASPLGRIDREQHAFGVDLRRKGKLDQDAVDFVAAVEVADQRQQLFGGRVLRELGRHCPRG